METMREEKLEAIKAAGEYLERLIPGVKTVAAELRGQKNENTDKLLQQCVDGINWLISIYNRVKDILEEAGFVLDKDNTNQMLGVFGQALQEKSDVKIAEAIENGVVPFLEEMQSGVVKAL